MHGDCSGNVELTETEVLNGKQIAKKLIDQSSDPEFFQVDEKGNDIDD